jgi:glycosyltransferase involved in cell wall biosynthesis
VLDSPTDRNSVTTPRVVYVLPVLQPAGAERIVAELARRIPSRGYGTSVICLEDERAPVGQELTAAGVPVAGLRLSRRRTLRCAAALARSIPKTRPLILHAHLFHANLAARFAVSHLSPVEREGLCVVNTVHIAERRFRPWQFALDRFTAKRACAEICVSRFVAAFHQRRTGLPASFFPVIENGIDPARFAPSCAEPIEPFRGNNVRILSVGRLNRQKDFPTLLRAWPAIHAAFPQAILSIAGDGPERMRLHALQSELRLNGVTFLGHVQDIPSLMRQADLYVQPSAWEGLPLTVAEAMACRLPIVVSDADSLPDMISHGRTGLVVPKQQPSLLADAILLLLNNPGPARSFAVAAHAEAIARFSLDRMVADYADFYDRLLK